ncbi:MAG: kynurenine 3-monooxygenase, partial [Flavobacteriaceae bacterium]|nr:kynurenine 3-monooxygenase [Flavobacteriaceae bacterium]
YEMRDHVANPIFQKKRQIEMELEKAFPQKYNSKYSLVTFNENIGYNEAMVRGRAQDKAILNMIADKEISIDDDLTELLIQVRHATEEILEDDRVAKTMGTK